MELVNEGEIKKIARKKFKIKRKTKFSKNNLKEQLAKLGKTK